MRGANAARSAPSRLRRVGDGLGGCLERVVARRAELRVGNHPLRHLQLQNDEQAVVQDEVAALSGTLRAVAASVVQGAGASDGLLPEAVPRVSEANIQIHRQFSLPTTDQDPYSMPGVDRV